MILTIEFINKRILEQLNYIQYIEFVSNKSIDRKALLYTNAHQVLDYFKNLKEEHEQGISNTIQKS